MKTIKLKLIRDGGESRDGSTLCTHIQIREDGKFKGFQPHTHEFIDWFNSQEFIIQDTQ